jgi:hypothetical protein
MIGNYIIIYIFAVCVCYCVVAEFQDGVSVPYFGNPFSIASNAARSKEVFLLHREPMQSFEGRQCPQERLQGTLASCAVAGMGMTSQPANLPTTH